MLFSSTLGSPGSNTHVTNEWHHLSTSSEAFLPVAVNGHIFMIKIVFHSLSAEEYKAAPKRPRAVPGTWQITEPGYEKIGAFFDLSLLGCVGLGKYIPNSLYLFPFLRNGKSKYMKMPMPNNFPQEFWAPQVSMLYKCNSLPQRSSSVSPREWFMRAALVVYLFSNSAARNRKKILRHLILH